MRRVPFTSDSRNIAAAQRTDLEVQFRGSRDFLLAPNPGLPAPWLLRGCEGRKLDQELRASLLSERRAALGDFKTKWDAFSLRLHAGPKRISGSQRCRPTGGAAVAVRRLAIRRDPAPHCVCTVIARENAS
jgi:hypothetical protein